MSAENQTDMQRGHERPSRQLDFGLGVSRIFLLILPGPLSFEIRIESR